MYTMYHHKMILSMYMYFICKCAKNEQNAKYENDITVTLTFDVKVL